VGGWVDLSSGDGGTTLILSVPLPEQAAGLAEVDIHTDFADANERHDPSHWGDL
jgi:hypothetical protein